MGFQISPDLKIVEEKGAKIEKWILRKAFDEEHRKASGTMADNCIDL